MEGNSSEKNKLVAGLLGIFLGAYGVHNFYLGYVGKGIAQIFVTIFTCGIGSLWGFIEGILILTGSIFWYKILFFVQTLLKKFVSPSLSFAK